MRDLGAHRMEMVAGEVDSETDSSGSASQPQKKAKGPKFWRLLTGTTSGDRQVEPEHYLAAIAELLALTIAMSCCITWLYSQIAYHCEGGACGIPDFNFKFAKTRFVNNPIRNMVGYNNPCAFWDQPPALYFAAFMFCPMVFFAFRYAVLDSIRARLRASADHEPLGLADRCCLGINWTYAISQCIVMGIFVVTPHVYGDYWPIDESAPTVDEIKRMKWKMCAHSACFLQLVPILCLTMSANYFEAYINNVPMEWYRWAALGFYITATILETIFASTAIFMYNGDYSQNPGYEANFVWPPTFLMCVDYTWFISLPIAATFQPPSPDIRIRIDLVEDGHDHISVLVPRPGEPALARAMIEAGISHGAFRSKLADAKVTDAKGNAYTFVEFAEYHPQGEGADYPITITMRPQEKEIRFLPKNVDGVPVLIRVGKNRYLVDNTHLQDETPGVGYRRTKNMEDRDPNYDYATWGSSIDAKDDGDGWVRLEFVQETRSGNADES